jgi:uncharacterized membrane protein
MLLLILGLLLFLGPHSVRIVADGWRTQLMRRLGPGVWKGGYALISVVGLLLIVIGYGQARLDPQVLWASPTWTRHLAALLVLVSLVLLVAAYVPGNSLKARVHHPMVLGVKVWALSHLVANNTLADVLLFGGFLAWAVADFVSLRRRDRAAGTVYPAGRLGPTLVAVVLGVGLWAVFAFWAHGALFGVRPFG